MAALPPLKFNVFALINYCMSHIPIFDDDEMHVKIMSGERGGVVVEHQTPRSRVRSP